MLINTAISNKFSSSVFLSLILLFVAISFIFASCKNKEEKPPVAEEIMKKVIVDLQTAESYSLGLGSETDSIGRITRYNKNEDSLYLFYSAILNHYNLTFEKFNEAVAWYKERPKDMDSLISHSLEELNRQKAKLGMASSSEDTEEEGDLNELKTAPGFQMPDTDSRQIDSSGKLPVLLSDSIPAYNDTAKNNN